MGLKEESEDQLNKGFSSIILVFENTNIVKKYQKLVKKNNMHVQYTLKKSGTYIQTFIYVISSIFYT